MKKSNWWNIALFLLLGNCGQHNSGHRENFSAEQDLLLHKTVREGNLKDVQTLLKFGIDINEQDEDGNTALHYAVILKNLEIFNFLLANGAYVDAVDKHQCTPLFYAISGSDEFFISLLNAGADIWARDQSGQMVIHHIGNDPAKVQLLLDHIPEPSEKIEYI